MDDIAERWARDPETGKTYTVPGSMTYKQWKKKFVDNGEKSGIIKSIRIDDAKVAVKGSAIKEEVAEKVVNALESHNAAALFDKVSVKKLGAEIVFQTEPQKVGTFFDVAFVMNEDVLGGKTVAEIDALFSAASNTIANSMNDAVIHEMYHSKLIRDLNYAQLESLYDELNSIHIEGLSKTAMIDGSECIAEVGILVEREETDKVPQKALDLFERFFGEK